MWVASTEFTKNSDLKSENFNKGPCIYQCLHSHSDPSMRHIDGFPFKVVQVGESENVERFCYLGGMRIPGSG